MNEQELRALTRLLAWAKGANSRLEYERVDGFQFGGNPEMNPIFRSAELAIENHNRQERDSEGA